MDSFYSQQAGCIVRWQELPGRGEPLVFIHGLGCASSYEYPRIVCDPQFGSRRAILIDLPGSGYSEKPEAFSYQTSSQAQVVIELLNHLAITSFWLYGHSMGGSIAIETAELAGTRLLGLIVSEPNFHPGGGAFSRDIAAQTEDDFVRTGYQAMLEAETSGWKGCLQSNAPWAVWRGATSLVNGVEPSWNLRFQQLACPVWLIFGELSLPDNDVDEMRQQGIEVKIIPDAGHSMSWEKPSALAKVLSDCLQARSDPQ